MSTTVFVSKIACDEHARGTECRYQVAWAINPHMTIGAVTFDRAVEQHAAYVAALEVAGATVVQLPFVHGAYDSVFAKDPAVLVARGSHKRAVLASLRCPERHPERRARARVYEQLGFEVVDDDGAPHWEGGDTVMFPSGRALFLGQGERTRPDAVAWLERQLDIPVTPLELTDPRLYHLDMALAVLPDGCAIVCERALSPAAMARLERAPGIRSIAVVPANDALAFGLNIVAIGDTVIGGAAAPHVAKIVRARGYAMRVVPLDEFHHAGGSAACLAAVVHTGARAETTRAIATRPPPRDVYGAVFGRVLQPAWETHVRRRPVMTYYRQLEASQWASLDELTALQAGALQRLVRHAYDHVPLYRRIFEARAISPDDIRDARDLAKLPVLRRADLADRAARLSAVRPHDMITKQTSGTTGEPLLFGYERESEHWRRAVKMRGYAWAGYRPGDRAVHFWGATLPTRPPLPKRIKVALDRALHREHYVPCDVMSDDRLHQVVELIRASDARVLVCYAQAGAELARFIHRNGLRTWQAINVICGAERLSERDRADLRAAFGPRVFDTYGCREVMMIGGECEAHEGLHVSMENLVVEIVVTDNGVERPAREGETGEVVLTDLHNLASPFLRYANGDIATVGAPTRCSCGRTLPRIQSVQGRLSESLRDSRGAAISGIAVSFLFHDLATEVRQFQAVQHKDHSVSINVILHDPAAARHLPVVQRNAATLLGGLDVRVNAVHELPRTTAGKHRLVVVER